MKSVTFEQSYKMFVFLNKDRSNLLGKIILKINFDWIEVYSILLYCQLLLFRILLSVKLFWKYPFGQYTKSAIFEIAHQMIEI